MKYAYSSLIIATVLLSGCESTMQNITNVTKGAMESLGPTADSSVVKTFTEGVTIAPGLASQDPLLASYGTAVIMMFNAQELWLEAIGKDEAAAKLRTERLALENGAVIDRDSILKHVEMSKETETIFAETMKSETELTDEGKAVFYRGWGPYVGGLLQTRKIVMGVGDYYDYIISDTRSIEDGMNKLGKGVAVGSVATNGLEFGEIHYDSLVLAYNYAKEKNLEIPTEAENLLEDFEI